MSPSLFFTLLPMILSLGVIFIWRRPKTWYEPIISLMIGAVLTAGAYSMGVYSQTADVEIWNGQVAGKTREHGSYVRSYSCNCVTTTDSKGQSTTTCQTCTEDHYTVDWNCQSTIGAIKIAALDETSQSVYSTPDPAFYTRIQRGDPVAQRHSFVNYVKAVPESLFHANDTQRFEKLIPPYPDGVYNFYSLDRAISMGVPVPDLNQWNEDISIILRDLGPAKQANIIVLFVNTNDESYVHALEGKWIGGKKNDIIVILGVTQYPKIDFVAISSWTDKQLFKVELRDAINAIGQVDRPQIIKVIHDNTLTSFSRKRMRDFEYLKSQIEPPTWVLVTAAILGVLGSFGTSWFFNRNARIFLATPVVVTTGDGNEEAIWWCSRSDYHQRGDRRNRSRYFRLVRQFGESRKSFRKQHQECLGKQPEHLGPVHTEDPGNGSSA